MRRAPAPTVDPAIETELLEMSPAVFLVWNSAFRSYEKWGTTRYEGRWEIWCELRESQHPDASNQLDRTDRWNSEHQCYMRKLQVYETEDGEFAPADRGLVKGLKMADAWADRRFYEEHVEEAHKDREARRRLAREELMRGSAQYYYDHDRLLVGPDVNSGWRWRTR